MGWSLVKIGEVCDVIAGQSPEGKYYNTHSDGLPFYQGKKEFGDKFISQPSSWTSKVTKVAIAGDILMSVRAPVGPINFSTQKCCIGRGLAAIRASDRVNRDFLFYSLLSNQDVIKGNEGAVFSSINKTQIGQLEIPLPPIPEQQLIVSILDQAFADIEKARANAERNLKNARELFDSYLNQVFSQRGEGWVEHKLVEVVDVIDSLHKTPKYSDTGYAMVRVTDIKPGALDLSKTRKVCKATYEEFSKRYKARVGDIVFSRVGSYGKSSIVTSNEPFCLGQNTVFLAPSMNGYYFYYFLNSPRAKEQIDNLVAGTTQPTLSLKSLKSLVIPIPAAEIQLKIVTKLNHFSDEIGNLESIYKNKLSSLEELKKSLLQKAFSGELTKTEGHAA